MWRQRQWSPSRTRGPVLVWLLFVIKHHDQRQWGGKGLFHLHLTLTQPMVQRRQGRNQEAGAEAQTTEESCWKGWLRCLLLLPAPCPLPAPTVGWVLYQLAVKMPHPGWSDLGDSLILLPR